MNDFAPKFSTRKNESLVFNFSHDPPELGILGAIRLNGYGEEGENGREKMEIDDASESRDSSSWPWNKVVEQLTAAQEELSIALDIISKVEIATSIGVASVGRSKLQPEESSSNLALEISVKQSMSKVGEKNSCYSYFMHPACFT